ncbi:MAG: hypothetical protein ACREHD_22830 [Pirellulales bacterium]
MTQPIFRDGDPETEVVDGAIFAFAQATDPELLLLEARAEKDRPLTWWWAAGRMSMAHLDVRYRDKLPGFWRVLE